MIEQLFTGSRDQMWPPKGHENRLRRATRYRQLFEGDIETIKSWAARFRVKKYPLDEFVPFPAPEIAVRTLASFLFGEDARFTVGKGTTRTELEQRAYLNDLIAGNSLHALNQETAVFAAYEGEGYYKLDVDQDISADPIISTLPGSQAYPLFRYKRLVEVAFVSEYPADDGATIFRHVEIRTKGSITNRLYRGTSSTLGLLVPLAELEFTADIPDDVDHGIGDILVRHVPFWRGASPHGISMFRGKEGLIDALHGLYSQDQHDAEMSKKRVAGSSEYFKREKDGSPKFDRSLDVLELSDAAAGPAGGDTKPLQVIEFADTTVMGERIAQRFDEFLLACGISPESAGRDVVGAAESGTARKLAQQLTLQTVATAGRYFAPALKQILEVGSVVGERLTPRPGTIVLVDVQVAMQDGTVDDDVEQAGRISTLRSAQAMSIEQAVREQHPDWEDDEVEAEVERIKEDEGVTMPDPLAAFNNGDADVPAEDNEPTTT